MRIYKDVFVAKGSDLALALAKSDAEAKKVYKATTAAYERTFSKEDRDWFHQHQVRAIAAVKSNTLKD